MSVTVQFVDIDWRDRRVSIEYQWLAPERGDAPLIVFLHEGLGSLSMWKDFPQRLCSACGCRGLVYSRPGYGRSTPRAPGEKWDTDFMHRQAYEVLPGLLEALGLAHESARLWLLGHSDGASIALLYAARFARTVTGLIVLAPHVMVEDVSIASIEQARVAYLGTALRARLARYHDEPDSAFWGWNDIWLQPSFRAWSIEGELAAIACPVLAVQGLNDEYGSMAQIRGIAQRVAQVQTLELGACGHSPQRDQPDRVIAAVRDFISRHPVNTICADQPTP